MTKNAKPARSLRTFSIGRRGVVAGFPFVNERCPNGQFRANGGSGIVNLVADAEAIYSYEGTREMNTLIVGKSITGLSAFV